MAGRAAATSARPIPTGCYQCEQAAALDQHRLEFSRIMYLILCTGLGEIARPGSVSFAEGLR